MILVKACRSNTRPSAQCLLLLHANAVVVRLLSETMADYRVRTIKARIQRAYVIV